MSGRAIAVGLVLALNSTGCADESGGGSATTDDSKSQSEQKRSAAEKKSVTTDKPVLTPEQEFTLIRVERAEKLRAMFDRCDQNAGDKPGASLACEGYLSAASCMQTTASERELIDCEYEGRAEVAQAKCLDEQLESAASAQTPNIDVCERRREEVLATGKRKAANAPDEPITQDARQQIERSFDKTVGSRFGGWNYSRCVEQSTDSYVCEGRAGGEGGVWDAEILPGGEVTFTPRQ